MDMKRENDPGKLGRVAHSFTLVQTEVNVFTTVTKMLNVATSPEPAPSQAPTVTPCPPKDWHFPFTSDTDHEQFQYLGQRHYLGVTIT